MLRFLRCLLWILGLAPLSVLDFFFVCLVFELWTRRGLTRCGEPGHRVPFAIRASRGPGRWVVRRRAQVELNEGFSNHRWTQIAFVYLACLAGRFDAVLCRESGAMPESVFAECEGQEIFG